MGVGPIRNVGTPYHASGRSVIGNRQAARVRLLGRQAFGIDSGAQERKLRPRHAKPSNVEESEELRSALASIVI